MNSELDCHDAKPAVDVVCSDELLVLKYFLVWKMLDSMDIIIMFVCTIERFQAVQESAHYRLVELVQTIGGQRKCFYSEFQRSSENLAIVSLCEQIGSTAYMCIYKDDIRAQFVHVGLSQLLL